MIINTNIENANKINVNKKLDFKKIILRKIPAGLSVAGAIFLLSSCGSIDKKFDYDQTSTMSFEEQFNNEHNTNIDLNDEVNEILKNYDICQEAYKVSLKQNNQITKVNARTELINAANNLTNASMNIIKEKVKEALDLDDEAQIKYIYEQSDNTYSLIITVDNNIVSYDQNKFPNEFLNIIEGIDSIDSYSGNGENEAWEKAIVKFEQTSTSLYNNTVDLLQNSYTVENGNIINNTKTK